MVYIYIVLDLVYKNVKRKGGESGRIDLTNERQQRSSSTTFQRKQNKK